LDGGNIALEVKRGARTQKLQIEVEWSTRGCKKINGWAWSATLAWYPLYLWVAQLGSEDLASDVQVGTALAQNFV
jgi:hypothetical protein